MKLVFVNEYNCNGRECSLPLNTKEDFDRVVELFPQLEDSMYRSKDLRQIAKDMAAYLSSHHIKAWVSEE